MASGQALAGVVAMVCTLVVCAHMALAHASGVGLRILPTPAPASSPARTRFDTSTFRRRRVRGARAHCVALGDKEAAGSAQPPATDAAEELNFLDEDEDVPFDFDEIDSLPPLPDALAAQLGLAGVDLSDGALRGAGEEEAGAGGRGGGGRKRAGRPKAGDAAAVDDDEDELGLDFDLPPFAGGGGGGGADGAEGALSAEEDAAAAAAAARVVGAVAGAMEGVDDDVDDLVGSAVDQLMLDDDDDDDVVTPAPKSSARGKRRGRASKVGAGDEEDGGGDEEEPEFGPLEAAAVPSPSDLNIDENDEDSVIGVAAVDDDAPVADDDDADGTAGADIDDELEEEEEEDDLDDDDDVVAVLKATNNAGFGSDLRAPRVPAEGAADGAADGLEADAVPEDVNLLSVFEDELSVDGTGELVDGMGNLWSGVSFADAAEGSDIATELSDDDLAAKMGEYLATDPRWKRSKVLAFLKESLAEDEVLLEVRSSVVVDDDDEEFDEDEPLDDRALAAIDAFWADAAPLPALTTPDDLGVPRDVDQIARVRMSLVAMLADEACVKELGAELTERATVLAQELRHTSDMLVETKKEGWKLNYCPFLKEAIELVDQHAPEEYRASGEADGISEPTLPEELRGAYVIAPAQRPAPAKPPSAAAAAAAAAAEDAAAQRMAEAGGPDAPWPEAATGVPPPGVPVSTGSDWEQDGTGIDDAALDAALRGLDSLDSAELEGGSGAGAGGAGAAEAAPGLSDEAPPAQPPPADAGADLAAEAAAAAPAPPPKKRGRKPKSASQPAEAAEAAEAVVAPAAKASATPPDAVAPKPKPAKAAAQPKKPKKPKPTGLAALKVVELREELSKRGLKTSGLKAVLVERLQEAIDAEKAAGSGGGADAATGA